MAHRNSSPCESCCCCSTIFCFCFWGLEALFPPQSLLQQCSDMCMSQHDAFARSMDPHVCCRKVFRRLRNGGG